MSTIVTVQDLVVGYNRRAVARLDRLDVAPDRVTVAVGPNGSGKTTLLKTLAGLLPPVSGRITPPPSSGRGGAIFVHSAAFLFGGTVRANMLVAADEREAQGALASLGVAELWTRDGRTLSAGQRQRVAIARALAAGPRVLLVDEPEGGLDAEGIAAWRRVVENCLAQGVTAIVMAAHRPQGIDGLPVQSVTLAARHTET